MDFESIQYAASNEVSRIIYFDRSLIFGRSARLTANTE